MSGRVMSNRQSRCEGSCSHGMAPMLVASHDTCGIILIVKVPSAVRIDEKSVGIIHEIDGRAKVYPRSIGASIVAWYWGISRNTRREECARLCNSMACKANGNQSNDHRKHLEISRSSLDFRRKMAGSMVAARPTYD